MRDHSQGDVDSSGSRRLGVVVLACAAAMLGLRLAFAGMVELLPEEAYYWTYAQHRALSYFDHPPMVAWLIAAGTALLGDTELGVRIGTILLSLGSCLLIYLTARIWFGDRAARWSALAFLLLPVYVGTGTLAFPDGPLIFFWLLTLYGISKALSGARPIVAPGTVYWLLTGVAFGAALLSKYTAVMLAPSLLLFLLLSREHRHWLRRPQPWVALAVALVVFSPVIVWNAQHEWASFLFQSTRTVGQRHRPLRDVAEFWGYQMVAVSPVVFALLAGAAARGVRCGWLRGESRWNFAVSFALPVFAVFAVAALKTRIHLNWTAPAFLSLLPAGCALFVEGGERRWWRASAAAALAMCGGALVLGFTTMVWGMPKVFAQARVGGWRELTERVEDIEHELERRTGLSPFILGADKYYLSAELGFYSREPAEQVNTVALGRHGLGFRYWTDLRKLQGMPAVAVLDSLKPGRLEALRRHFERLEQPQRIVVRTAGRRSRVFWVVNCYGFRPPSSMASDVEDDRGQP